ncbi:hypothetical protein [Cryobacterium sp. PAMC25264]|uniref:hypothetical protein n=1 Tax=Cryobacterium sp. PAMC25264 TaxID=2861288 RepID=UPI001C629451|nr:hypothetical protein [Cryobacterium sp. PAMC25264]QYF74140.1 hypothetical protein KY500_02560 [Cryobacterium sp. PAMC25264]
MDSSWAVVIGAGIALLGSVFAPWLKDSLERRHLQREGNRSAVSRSLLRITAAAPDVALARLQAANSNTTPKTEAVKSIVNLALKQSEASQAVFELGLLLSARDAPLETMARSVINAAAGKDDFSVEVICFTQTAARWYRMELSAKDALSSFKSDVIRYRAQNLGVSVATQSPHEEPAESEGPTA